MAARACGPYLRNADRRGAAVVAHTADGPYGAAISASVASAVNGVALITYVFIRTGLMAHPWPERATAEPKVEAA